MHNGMGGQQRGGHGMMHGRVGGGFNANVRDADYGGGYNAFGAGALPQRYSSSIIHNTVQRTPIYCILFLSDNRACLTN